MTDELIALLEGTEIGRVRQGTAGRLEFEYDSAWRARDNALPLSLSMPLAASRHGHDVVYSYLSGLLPDNERVLDAWGRRFGVSPRNPFALLTNVGEDCAGAVQFVQPDNEERFRRGDQDQIVWITEHELAERLRLLRQDNAAWRRPSDSGQFSLAGAQPKTALILEGGRWGVPSGRIPTTHILKPPSSEFDGLIENEHFCLELAARVDFPVARSSVRRFEDQVAIVVERYDRVLVGDRVVRVHQEDLCQSLGIPPLRRYESEGGPGVIEIVELVRTHSGSPLEDMDFFLRAVAFNWIVGATDGHAKNFSILIGPAARTRLAPLYDVASALPFPSLNDQKMKLAMRVGSDYRLNKIGRAQWVKLAHALRIDAQKLTNSIEELLRVIPEAANDTYREVGAELKHPIIARIADAIQSRIQDLLRSF